jgi:hypothetical protein
MLAYGISIDATDEYCRTGESTAIEGMKRFRVAIQGCFKSHFLRLPTRADFQRQIDIYAACGFPGMFSSLDCMHWTWKNCPTAWQGQFQDKDGLCSIILEAIADQSLWIWHAFFGLPGSNNDINVLDRSPLVANLLGGEGSDMTFEVNGHVYKGYYLLTMGYILSGAVSCSPFTSHKVRRRSITQRCKLQPTKMWSALLECCRLAGRLSKILAGSTTWIPSQTS